MLIKSSQTVISKNSNKAKKNIFNEEACHRWCTNEDEINQNSIKSPYTLRYDKKEKKRFTAA